jgi:hypothetical protein
MLAGWSLEQRAGSSTTDEEILAVGGRARNPDPQPFCWNIQWEGKSISEQENSSEKIGRASGDGRG